MFDQGARWCVQTCGMTVEAAQKQAGALDDGIGSFHAAHVSILDNSLCKLSGPVPRMNNLHFSQ